MNPPSRESYLQFEGMTKLYPGVRALDGVSFGVNQGSVHALLGENGAGKSTLLKCLSGAHLPTDGTMRVGGEAVHFKSTAQALAAGVAVIYQELHLVGQLTVAENLFLGHLPASGGIIRRRELLERSEELLKRVGENIHPKTLVSRLPIGQRQMIEIAKALNRGATILAFDEPTSSLSAREIAKLFEVIGELQRQQCAILYVTHRMEEVFKICDSATVLRDGKHVVTFDAMAGVTHERIVKAMVGRDIADIFGYRPREVAREKPPALEVTGMMGPGLKAPASLKVMPGEIVGLFGLVGAGRSEMMRLIFGAEHKTEGTVQVEGRAKQIHSPQDAIKAGVLLCPEDRKKEGIIPVRSVMENINISARRHHLIGKFVINSGWERSNAQKRVTELGVKTPTLGQEIRLLSGGNQQKAILGRWLSENIKVILLDEPTRGIDVGAKSEIYAIIYRLAEAGAGVVVVSSDLPEVLGVSDRVVVMREGRMAADLSRAEATPERVMAAALPVSNPPIAEGKYIN